MVYPKESADVEVRLDKKVLRLKAKKEYSAFIIELKR